MHVEKACAYSNSPAAVPDHGLWMVSMGPVGAQA